MVSIRESITELERILELQNASLECYRSAIQAIAKFPVEFDADATDCLRRDLASLSTNVRGEADPLELLQSRSVLRDELRNYHDKAASFLSALREELSQKAHALDLIVDAMADADGDHEERLRHSLRRLRELSDTPAALPIRTALLSVSDQLTQSIEQMKQQFKLMIGQFRVEIKMLHNQVETLRTTSSKASSGQLNGRLDLETRISDEIQARGSFSVLLLKIRNLPVIERQFGAQVRAEVMATFAARVNDSLPENATFGRWSEEQFIAVVKVEKSVAVALVKRLTQRIAEDNPGGEDRKPRRPLPQVSIGVLVNSPADTYESLTKKIDNYL